MLLLIPVLLISYSCILLLACPHFPTSLSTQGLAALAGRMRDGKWVLSFQDARMAAFAEQKLNLYAERMRALYGKNMEAVLGNEVDKVLRTSINAWAATATSAAVVVVVVAV